MTSITAETAMDVWCKALSQIQQNGKEYIERNNRSCIEMRNLLLTIERCDQTILEPIHVLTRSDKWIYPDLGDVAQVILSPKSASSYDYSYGKRLFSTSDAVNQIDGFVVPILQKDPTSRKAVALLFDPQTDSNPLNKENPSMIAFDFKIRDGKLHITGFIRSSDMFIGWPANIYQMYVIQEYVAKKLHVPLGSMTTISTSAHIFAEHLVDIAKILKIK
ncbi:MAG TPA: thymidylate synthase [Acidobacteriota bacterium]|nr:thymidylate synthase [Acidobacteriota bacterium]